MTNRRRRRVVAEESGSPIDDRQAAGLVSPRIPLSVAANGGLVTEQDVAVALWAGEDGLRPR